MKRTIGYITGAFDRKWKPLTMERFYLITDSVFVQERIEKIRAEEDKNQQQKLKKSLPAFFFMGMTADGCIGSRKKKNLVPTGLAMVDIDAESGNGRDLYETFEKTCKDLSDRLLLAHRTPSGHGLRLVFPLEAGETIESLQIRTATQMGVAVDTACKDISRLSYAPMTSDIFFVSDRLFKAEEIPTAKPNMAAAVSDTFSSLRSVASSASSASASSVSTASSETSSSSETSAASAASFPDSYDGIPYEKIVQALTDVLGGAPAHGSRNQFIFSMACHLRHICDHNPDWIESILPNFGENQQKVHGSIVSACNRQQVSKMPYVLKRALAMARGETETETNPAVPPQMPSKLPLMIEAVVKNVPDFVVPSMSQMCFPALAAHINKICFRYIDTSLHEASLMQVQVGKTAVGKGYVNEPLSKILQDIELEDKHGRALEEEWRETCSTLGANTKKPPRPDVCIRLVSSNMTNAIFVQRLIDSTKNGEKYMFSRFNEIEMLDDVAKGVGGGRKEVSKIIRLTYDNDEYGQERVGQNSVSGKGRIRWNWVASTTINNCRNYFSRMISDGTLNRLSFSFVEQTDRTLVPLAGIYTEEYLEALEPYLENLKTWPAITHDLSEVTRLAQVVDTEGRDLGERLVIKNENVPFVVQLADGRREVFCPEAYRLAKELNQQNAEQYLLSDNDVFNSFSFRANVIAYKKAMVLYLANGCRWDETFADFIKWSEEYDLWCKMQLFGELAANALGDETMQNKKASVTNMLSLLPSEFTKEDLQLIRSQLGMKRECSQQIKNWVNRGFIIRKDKKFIKT